MSKLPPPPLCCSMNPEYWHSTTGDDPRVRCCFCKLPMCEDCIDLRNDIHAAGEDRAAHTECRAHIRYQTKLKRNLCCLINPIPELAALNYNLPWPVCNDCAGAMIMREVRGYDI